MDTPAEDSIQRKFHGAAADWLGAAEARQPFGRLLKTDEVARTIAFLCSDESGMMTGSIIDLDQSVLGAYDDPPQPAGRIDAGQGRGRTRIAGRDQRMSCSSIQ